MCVCVSTGGSDSGREVQGAWRRSGGGKCRDVLGVSERESKVGGGGLFWWTFDFGMSPSHGRMRSIFGGGVWVGWWEEEEGWNAAEGRFWSRIRRGRRRDPCVNVEQQREQEAQQEQQLSFAKGQKMNLEDRPDYTSGDETSLSRPARSPPAFPLDPPSPT